MSRVRIVCTVLLLAFTVGSLDIRAESSPLNSKLQAAFDKGELKGLHGVLVVFKGDILAERYFPGHDERWGQSLGVREHGPATLHDLRSVTKSVVSLLYGIALAEGKVPKLDESLLAQFKNYPDLAEDEARKAILIRHALSMTMGTEWNESLPYSDPKNSEIAMELAADRYRFVLDRPMVEKPGERWEYNGGATAIIAKLIADGVGTDIDKYAEEKLFKPLGIQDFEWIRGADGVPSAASGLRLNIHDVAKIGQLALQNGKFNGNQIVPARWLKNSFTPHTDVPDGLRYGFFWWLAGEVMGKTPAWVAGFGNGGQRLAIQPKIGLVVVVLAGNYNQPDDWKLPVKIITDFVAPEIRLKLNKK